VLYDVAGPLFFGAAQKAMSALRAVERRGVHVVVLDLEHVPAMDVTGIVGLESLVARLNEAGTKVILVGVQGQPLRALARAGWRNRKGRLRIFRSFERGIAVARRTAAEAEPSGAPQEPRAGQAGAGKP
jgi:SulP family sulfate permease